MARRDRRRSAVKVRKGHRIFGADELLRLSEMFRYDAVEGVFYFSEHRPAYHFKAKWAMDRYYVRDAGRVAGCLDRLGRWEVMFGREVLSRGRVVWELFRGAVPRYWRVYHLNGDLADDRLENLTLVDRRLYYRWLMRESGERSESGEWGVVRGKRGGWKVKCPDALGSQRPGWAGKAGLEVGYEEAVRRRAEVDRWLLERDRAEDLEVEGEQWRGSGYVLPVGMPSVKDKKRVVVWDRSMGQLPSTVEGRLEWLRGLLEAAKPEDRGGMVIREGAELKGGRYHPTYRVEMLREYTEVEKRVELEKQRKKEEKEAEREKAELLVLLEKYGDIRKK